MTELAVVAAAASLAGAAESRVVSTALAAA
jgi:hypothetical protein